MYISDYQKALLEIPWIFKHIYPRFTNF